MKIKKYRFVTLSIMEESDIIFYEYPENLNVDLEIAKEIVANRLEFAENCKHYMIMEMSNVKQVTYKAKLFMQANEGGLKDILGAAFIASNPVSTLVSNIFIKTPKSFPAKLFIKKEDALNWIKQLRIKNALF